MQDPDTQPIREIVLGKLYGDPERYLSEYTARFGRVLNADDAATLFDEYNADRARYLFRSALAESARQGKDSVVFAAGSTAIEGLNRLAREKAAAKDPRGRPPRRRFTHAPVDNRRAACQAAPHDHIEKYARLGGP